MCLLCINVLPFTKCHSNLPLGQRECIYCYSSARNRPRDTGMDSYAKGENDDKERQMQWKQ